MVLSKRVTVDKAFVFSRIDDVDVYQMYVPGIKFQETMCSPLRQDKHPSWIVFKGEEEWVYKDWASGEVGNCIKLVMQMFGLKYGEAIQKIAKDFLLTAGDDKQYKKITAEYEHPVVAKHRSFIQITTKPYSVKELQWWGKYGIGKEQLQKEHIYSVKELYVDRKRRPIDEMTFGYWYPSGFKIYQPLKPKGENKWLSSIPTGLIENIQALDTYEKIVISKSRKDRMVLQNLFPEIGIINSQNEGKSWITDDVIKQLKEKKVWLSFDSDAPGVAASKKIHEMYDWMNYINVPTKYSPHKDWGEIMEHLGPEPIVEHFKNKGVI